MSFINKVKDKNNVSYDIHDERVPEILAENEGKILKVQNGELAFADAPSGGTKLYKHTLSLQGSSPNSLIEIINTSSTPITAETIVYNTFQNAIRVTHNGDDIVLKCRYSGPSGMITFVPSSGFGYYFVYILRNIDSTYEIVDIDCSGVTEVTDTVTEL